MSDQMIHFVLEMIRPDIVGTGVVFIVRVVEIIRQRARFRRVDRLAITQIAVRYDRDRRRR